MLLSLSKILLLATLAQSEVSLLTTEPNSRGLHPFGYGGQPHDDISLPNPRFFDDLDKQIKRTPNLRLLLNDSPLLTQNGPEKARDFGRYLGRRFIRRKRFTYVAPAQPSAALQALIAGIREYDSVHWPPPAK